MFQGIRLLAVAVLLASTHAGHAQSRMTPELLWKLKRLSGPSVSPDGSQLLVGLSSYDLAQNKGDRDLYLISKDGGELVRLTEMKGSEFNEQWRPDGKKIGFLSARTGSVQLWEVNPDGSMLQQVSRIEGGINGFMYAPSGDKILYTKDVKLDQTVQELYRDLPKADARIIDDLMYRHWDNWHDYSYSHVFFASYKDGEVGDAKDIMEGAKWDSPLNPFGGMEQITFSADGRYVIYTAKKLQGKEWATSTNSDIYRYDTEGGAEENLSEGMMGYDMNPKLAPNGDLSWLSMKQDGFESDKNDIVVLSADGSARTNLTEGIDLTVSDFVWGPEAKKIYFLASVEATYQLFELDVKSRKHRQITTGDHNYTSIAVSADGKTLYGTRQDMNHPNDLWMVDIKKGGQTQMTDVNKEYYSNLKTSKVEKRWIKTTDGKQMLTWVIYPPDFDESKEYPTLLYCQGGPQAAVSQFFSFRWNFMLMAANGYIVVAPNRRGLPSFGQEWNDAISKDWGGQAMDDYLSAIDEVKKESYVDENRLGAVGASYGGYSVYYLAGIHNKRFKTFISHCGLFNLESWYGTTEELFFANWDIGGPYWVENPPESYEKFSPHNLVGNWDTPILVIHGDKDFRVPIGEGMQAFQAAQLQGIPSRFLYFPEEGHWVLNPQNGVLWHRVFFDWLGRTLKN